MRLAWMLGCAGAFAVCAIARAELVFSTIAEPGTVLPGSLAGETYTISTVYEARALLDGRIYFSARAQSSLAAAGTRDGIWSFQNGAYTLELLEGAAVSGGAAGLRVGRFDANSGSRVVDNFSINPSGALIVAVRLSGGDTDATNDRGVILHKAGANSLLMRGALAGASFAVGDSLLSNGAAFTEYYTVNGANEETVYVGVPFQGNTAVAVLADSTGGVIGENGSVYDFVRDVVQDASGNNAYRAQVTAAGGASDYRVGVYAGAYTFPIVTGTAIAGTGGALSIGIPTEVLPAPGGGWWLAGTVESGGVDLNFDLPFLYRNGSLESLFPGGTLAGIFGEDGLSLGIFNMGAALDGRLAFTIYFAHSVNDVPRAALVWRKADGTYRRLLEDDTALILENGAHTITSASVSSQPFTTDGTLAIFTRLDDRYYAILAARETSASPTVRIQSPRRHVIRQPRLVVRGSAADDGTVTEVRYRVNRSGERVANGTTRWNFITPRLRRGRNRIVIRAVDGDGGSSAPARLVVRLRSR